MGNIRRKTQTFLIGRRRRIWGFALLSWIFAIIAIAASFFGDSSPKATQNRGVLRQLNDSHAPITQFELVKRDPKENNRPIFAFGFGSLQVDNGQLGLFRSSLHKVIKIRDLEIRHHFYPSSQCTVQESNALEAIPGLLSELAGTLLGEVFPDKTHRNTVRTKHTWHIPIDTSNTLEVRVNNFNYQIYTNHYPELKVDCKQALASYRQDGILLRGHVKIITGNGRKLESNHVIWDIQNKLFEVSGKYALKHKEGKTHGIGIHLDYQLNLTGRQYANAR